MLKDDERSQPKNTEGALNKFEPGGALGPIEDRNEYEQRLNALPPDQNQLAQESTIGRSVPVLFFAKDRHSTRNCGTSRRTFETDSGGAHSRPDRRQPSAHGVSQ